MEEMLIEKVREHNVLYDHGSSDYRDQHIRKNAWEEIGQELKISVSYECTCFYCPTTTLQNMTLDIILLYNVTTQ
ncbi:transcription factor Adf-1-like [Aphis craccivora]|uniref:Transcription factor Adf-1-like n=1 Tax=Aphis craccivora TaxID=307492 RepID=A0A6G0VY78_APHCR|nr:transcription factor Adf-1-like [Aphis craccivora]